MTTSTYSKEGVKAFLQSLTGEEICLVWAMMTKQVADIGKAFDLNVLEIEDIYKVLIDGDPEKAFKKIAHMISRGIGTEVMHEGTMTLVTQEIWYIGPRGQWYTEWTPVYETLRDKIATY